jgi:hypothetical protein
MLDAQKLRRPDSRAIPSWAPRDSTPLPNATSTPAITKLPNWEKSAPQFAPKPSNMQT